MANVVGPGADNQALAAPDPILQGASEFEYVTVLNPLPYDFQPKVAQEVPTNTPMKLTFGKPSESTKDLNDVARNYAGIPLTNPNYLSRKYIYNTTLIPAGQTKNFSGDVAQVVVKQLVNEILQREGKKRFLADSVQRNEVERRIIKGRGSMQDLMEGGLVTPRQQIHEAVQRSNEVEDEPFPQLKQNQTVRETTEGAGTASDSDSESQKRTAKRPGRPAKATA